LELFYDFADEEITAMGDASGLAEAMLGLDGVRVTDVSEADGEVTIEVETTEVRAWCQRCGCRAERHLARTTITTTHPNTPLPTQMRRACLICAAVPMGLAPMPFS
jgi:hypothetical protein